MAPKTEAGWIPATSAGMKEIGASLAPFLYPCGRGREIIVSAYEVIDFSGEGFRPASPIPAVILGLVPSI
jgi:hypothetical protein